MILDDLSHSEEWHLFVDSVLRKKIPEVPAYNPDDDNTEKWKALSQQRQGYELCLALLNISLGEKHG